MINNFQPFTAYVIADIANHLGEATYWKIWEYHFRFFTRKIWIIWWKNSNGWTHFYFIFEIDDDQLHKTEFETQKNLLNLKVIKAKEKEEE